VAIQSVDSVELNVAGRNLLPPGVESVTKNGITATRNTDGSYSMSGTATSMSDIVLAYSTTGVMEFRRGATYAFKAIQEVRNGVVAVARISMMATLTALQYLSDTGGSPPTYAPTEDGTGITSCYVRVQSGVNVDGLTIYPMVYIGNATEQYQPYTSTVTPIPLSNHIARSLPDGTRDTLTLSYIGPSTEHEGWGVYSKTLVQRVGVATINASEWQGQTPASIGDGWYRTVKGVLSGAESVIAATATQGMCTAAQFVYNASLKSEHVGTQGVYMLLVAQESTAAAIAAKYDGATVLYKLATPVTHDLGEVELPVNPAPDLTAWADGGSAQPTLAMEYERSLSIVIPRIEAQLADMATS
jgi:hypothetical protein